MVLATRRLTDFFNPCIRAQALEVSVLRILLTKAGITRVKSLRAGGTWKSVDDPKDITDIKSSRFLQKVVDEIISAIPERLKEVLDKDNETGVLQQSDQNSLSDSLKDMTEPQLCEGQSHALSEKT